MNEFGYSSLQVPFPNFCFQKQQYLNNKKTIIIGE